MGPVEDKQAKFRHVSEEVEEAKVDPPVDPEEEERKAWLELRAAFGEEEELSEAPAVGKPVMRKQQEVRSEMPDEVAENPVEDEFEGAEGEDDMAEACVGDEADDAMEEVSEPLVQRIPWPMDACDDDEIQ